MADKEKKRFGRSRLAVPKTMTPDWFGWLGVLTMALLTVVRIEPSETPWFFPLLSLGEWLLMPLGAASLTMGLLALRPQHEKGVLPLWIAAVIPAAVWLAVVGIAILRNQALPTEGDMLLAWTVQLIFPTMAFLPLLAQRMWRNRLMWALLAGVLANIVLIIYQSAGGGGDNAGGFLAHRYDYGLLLGVSLPLLSAWRGGEIRKNRALIIMFCTFLLPAMALGTCNTVSGMAAAAAGLTVSWAAWRSPGWIMGIFLVLIVFGYGSQARTAQDEGKRARLAATAAVNSDDYERAFSVFVHAPFFGDGPGSFLAGDLDGYHATTSRILEPTPWYANLLGGAGIAGIGLWLVLLAEIAARALGRSGNRSLWAGGALGATAALAVSGLWTGGLPEGVGALVGLLLAISILPESDEDPAPRRAARRRKRENTGKTA
jgi:hypothetical protein